MKTKLRNRHELMYALRLELPPEVADDVERHIEAWHKHRKNIEREHEAAKADLREAIECIVLEAHNNAAHGFPPGDRVKKFLERMGHSLTG